MKIRTRLKISVIFYIFIVLVVAFFNYLTFRQTDKAEEDIRISNEIFTGVFELNLLTSEYLLYYGKRARAQWESKHESIQRLLSELEYKNSENLLIISRIQSQHLAIKFLFYQLVSSYESQNFNNDSTIKEQVSRRIISLLLVESQEMASEATLLRDLSYAESRLVQRRTIVWTMVLIVLLGAVMTADLLFISTNILKPLHKFHKGAEIIGTGNLDFEVKVESNDEIGRLAGAFNRMVTNLKTTMASRDELESRVNERTAELTLANEKLKKEIEDRRQAEKALGEKEEMLRQSQKMEAVGRLAGGIAHDFNNLLTAMIGYSDMLMMDSGLDENQRHYVQEIKKSSDRAASLTQQLLAFSRKQVLQPKVLNANALITNIKKMLRMVIGEDIHLLIKLDSELGVIKADPGQIEQVIMNLVVNARDAMPMGGKLTIETQNIYLDEEYCKEHSGSLPGRYTMLAVSDTGHGMDEETKKHIFEPFFTTREKGKGTGLGLSTVYGIVKQSGGYVWVYSEQKRGTTFKVYFQQVDAEVDENRGKVSEEIKSLKGSETILLVEDEEVVRDLIFESLKAFGYDVLKAENGKNALQVFKKNTDKLIHLLITDVVMPDMSGRKLAEKLENKSPSLKVLYISGYTDNAIVHHGILEEKVAFLQKPFSPIQLAKKVREVLVNK